MKKAILLLALVIFGMAETIYAQSAPNLPSSYKVKVFYPKMLNKAIVKVSEVEALTQGSSYGQDDGDTGKHWVVWSDRENNATYTKPDGKVKCGELQFNEKVRIADIKNGYAWVYSEAAEGTAYPKVSVSAVSRGWVPMSKLLLWKNCPTDDHGIYQKALICANLDATSKGMLAKGFGNPDNKSKHIQLSTDMNFYYVMKTEGSLALLALSHSMDGNSDKMLYCWVDQQSYVPWNQRSCVEPTWDREDVDFFAKNDVQIKVYETKATQGNAPFSLGFKTKEATSGKYDKHLYRLAGDLLRYPILDGSTSTLYNISTFAKHQGNGKYSAVADEGLAKARKNAEAVTQEMTNINIGIVIDGTKSMEEFYPAVIDALKTSCKEVFASQYNIKIGSVIYRDYTDGEKFAAEVFPLTSPKNEEFYAWLQNGGDYGIKSAKSDKTLEEALFHGMNAALDGIGFKKGQSNIMLVVGDCGNNRTDTKYSSEDIINKLVEMDVQVMGFQVRNSSAHQAFSLFNQQLVNLLTKSTQKRYDNLPMSSRVIAKYAKVENGYKLVNDQNSTLYIGSQSFASSNTKLSVDKLSSLIVNSVQDYAQSVQAGVDAMTHMTTFGFANANISGDVPEISKAFAQSRMKAEDYKILNQANALVTFSGYTHREHGSRQLFKPVIFISSEELDYLLEQLNGVNSAAVSGNPNDRTAYVRALTSLANTMTGDQSEVKRMSTTEIMSRIQGLNEASSALKGYSIQDISSPEVVNNATYISILNDFKNKYNALRRIKDQNYKYVKTMNGKVYYWIPVEDLP